MENGVKASRCIIVTGGAGFIGSHLTEELVRSYPTTHVVVIDKLGYCGNLNNLKACRAHSNFTFVQGDITDLQFCQDVFLRLKPRIIFHLAARTHVDHSFTQALDFTKDNIVGTHVLLETLRVLVQKGFPVERFIHCSTDEVYGESKEGEFFTEDHPLCPTNPYAATKASAESLVQSYKTSFQLPIIITRSNNVYGPHQYPEKVIAKWVLSLLPSGQSQCQIHGDGTNKRTYIFVHDLVEAFVLIMEKGVIGHIYNIGSKDECSNLELAGMLIRRLKGTDSYQKYIHLIQDRPYNDSRYNLDYEKIIRLGWSPTTPWDEGIENTIEWYRHMPASYWGQSVENGDTARPAG